MKKEKANLKHQPHNGFRGFLVEHNIRQKEVAKLLGISSVTLNQKINGYLHFTWDQIEKICDEYDIKPDVFLTKKLRNGNNN